MFALTYIMVFRVDEVFLNLNRFYMALIMVSSMPILMIVFMSEMFKNQVLNFVIIGLCIVLFGVTFWLIRTQTPIGDIQFLRSMIPHHSGAITMCERSNITDNEIEELCNQIVEQQKEEIGQMKKILQRIQ